MHATTTDPRSHDVAMICQVAQGLTMLVGVREAADQLQRVYGQRRAARAVLSMADATAAPVDHPPTTYLTPPRAPRRTVGARGRRPSDWL